MNSPLPPADPQTPPVGPASPQRRSALWTVAGVAVAAGGAGFLWSWMTGSSASSSTPSTKAGGSPEGRAATDPDRVGPEFWQAGLTAPDGSPLPLSLWQGKPLVLNFWATWCPPCVREMPLLDAFHQRWSARGLTVVGLAVDSPAPVQAYLKKTPMSFPIAMAGAVGTEMSRQWGNRQGGLPFSVLVDGESRILARHVGELQEATLEQWARRVGLGA